MAQRAFWRRAPLIVLILLNLGTALFVTLDLRHRLEPAPQPRGAAESGPIPTMIPAPTRQPAPSATPQPTLAAPTSTSTPTPTVTPTPTPTPALASLSAILAADDRFAYEPAFYADEVQAFLEEQGSVLAQTTVPVGKGQDTFAHALTAHCIRYGLNPKVVLALFEVQAGLVRAKKASAEKLKWAMGYHDPSWQGLERQMQWTTYTLADGFRGEEAGETPLLTDGTLAPIPGEANAATRALLRMLAHTANTKRFDLLRSDGPGSFVQTYRELFGEDPRRPLEQAMEPARQPFLWPPFAGSAFISSYFDHEYPIFRKNGSLLSYSGERGNQSYDGHDGWDYALASGTPVLAAAAGRVVFAGMVDTLCATPASLVALDHGNGYRTLYWHLQTIEVQEDTAVAQGDRLGTVGSNGCSTGPHLHLGVEFMGRDADPYGWCGSAEIPADPWAAHPAGTVSPWLWADRPSPCPVPAGAIVVDDQEAGFTKSLAVWHEAPVGYHGHAFWAIAVGEGKDSTHRVVWQPDLAEAGTYFLYAYIPWYDTERPDTTQARYTIQHAGGKATVTVDQASSTGLWVPLGEFSFAKGSQGYVYLDEVTGEAGRTVWFDAVVWVKKQ